MSTDPDLRRRFHGSVSDADLENWRRSAQRARGGGEPIHRRGAKPGAFLRPDELQCCTNEHCTNHRRPLWTSPCPLCHADTVPYTREAA